MFQSVDLNTLSQCQRHRVLASKFAQALAVMDDAGVRAAVEKSLAFPSDDGCVILVAIGNAFLQLESSVPCFGDVSHRKVEPRKDITATIPCESELILLCAELLYFRDVAMAGEVATALATDAEERRSDSTTKFQIVSKLLSEFANECDHRHSLDAAVTTLRDSDDARRTLSALLNGAAQPQILKMYASQQTKLEEQMLAMRTLYCLGLVVHESAVNQSAPSAEGREFAIDAYRATPFGRDVLARVQETAVETSVTTREILPSMGKAIPKGSSPVVGKAAWGGNYWSDWFTAE